VKTFLVALLVSLFFVVPSAQAQGTTFTRIQFQPGATSAQVSGQIAGGVGAGYVLGAAAGQTMSLSSNAGSLTVVSPSGTPLVRGDITASPVQTFTQVLPESGDYLVYVTVPGGVGTTNFNLTVSIVGTPDRTDAAERIRFQPGGTGAQVSGTLTGSQVHNYLLNAAASQTMNLSVSAGTLTVVSPSGIPLVRGTVVSTPVQNFSQVLPESGDYRISVNVPAAVGSINYTLTVSVLGNLTGQTAPQQIRFAAGATSATVNGQLASGQFATYVLDAFAGQMMTINAPNTYITLISPSGALLRSVLPNSVSQLLPESGRYSLQFSTVAGNTVNYSATVSITGLPNRTSVSERIQFQTGSSGAQVYGQVTGQQQNSYVLYAFGGQRMQINIDNGTLTVVSPSGSPLVRGEVTAQPVRSFNQVLPETGDYLINVSVPAGTGATPYTMTVIVTAQ
jgi:hypothetical protein